MDADGEVSGLQWHHFRQPLFTELLFRDVLNHHSFSLVLWLWHLKVVNVHAIWFLTKCLIRFLQLVLVTFKKYNKKSSLVCNFATFHTSQSNFVTTCSMSWISFLLFTINILPKCHRFLSLDSRYCSKAAFGSVSQEEPECFSFSLPPVLNVVFNIEPSQAWVTSILLTTLTLQAVVFLSHMSHVMAAPVTSSLPGIPIITDTPQDVSSKICILSQKARFEQLL